MSSLEGAAGLGVGIAHSKARALGPYGLGACQCSGGLHAGTARDVGAGPLRGSREGSKV